MNKWRYAYICYGASLAIVLAIAALPFSSWDFKNHIDLLTGGWHSSGNLAANWIEPTRIIEQTDFAGAQRPTDSKFSFAFADDYGAMVEYAHRNSENPSALGFVVRYAFEAPMDAPTFAAFRQWPGHTVADARREALWATDRGKSVDPDNTFFLLSEAALLNQAGKTEEAYADLARAASGTHYDDFGHAESEIRYEGMLKRLGYRGEKPHAEFLAAVLLPNDAAYKGLAKALKAAPQSKESVQAQCDILRSAATMQRTSQDLTGTLVATSIVAILTTNPSPRPLTYRDGESSQTQRLPYTSRVKEFKELQKTYGVDRPYDPTQDYEKLLRIRSAFDSIRDSLDPLAYAFDWRATVPSPAVLFALLLSVLFAALTFKIKPGAEWARVLLPYAAGVAAFWLSAAHETREQAFSFIQPEFYWGVPQPDPGSLAFWATFGILVLGVCQIFKRLRVPATVLACIGCGVVFLWTFPNPSLYLPPAIFLGGLLMARVRWKIPYPIIGLVFIALCVGCSLVAIQITLGSSTDMWLGYVLALAIFSTAILAANGSRRVLMIAPAATLIFSLAYLGFVAKEIRANQEIKVGLEGWTKQADLLRAQAGIASK